MNMTQVETDADFARNLQAREWNIGDAFPMERERTNSSIRTNSRQENRWGFPTISSLSSGDLNSTGSSIRNSRVPPGYLSPNDVFNMLNYLTTSNRIPNIQNTRVSIYVRARVPVMQWMHRVPMPPPVRHRWS